MTTRWGPWSKWECLSNETDYRIRTKEIVDRDGYFTTDVHKQIPQAPGAEGGRMTTPQGPRAWSKCPDCGGAGFQKSTARLNEVPPAPEGNPYRIGEYPPRKPEGFDESDWSRPYKPDGEQWSGTLPDFSVWGYFGWTRACPTCAAFHAAVEREVAAASENEHMQSIAREHALNAEVARLAAQGKELRGLLDAQHTTECSLSCPPNECSCWWDRVRVRPAGASRAAPPSRRRSRGIPRRGAVA